MTETYLPEKIDDVAAGFLGPVPLSARTVFGLPIESAEDFPSPGAKRLDDNGLPLALQYPGHRPANSFSVLQDRVIPGQLLSSEASSDHRFYVNIGSPTESLGVFDFDDVLREAEVPVLGERFPVVAFGSNANPGQLRQKFAKLAGGDKDIAPTLKANVSRMVPVYAGRIGINGYVFADIVTSRDPNVTTEAHVNFLSHKQLEAMAETEKAYALSKIDRVQIETGQGDVIESSAYIFLGRRDDSGAGMLADDKGRPIRLAEITTRGHNLPAQFGVMTQSAVQRYIFDIAGRAIAINLLIAPGEEPTSEHELIEIITNRQHDPRLERFRQLHSGAAGALVKPKLLGRDVAEAVQRGIQSTGRIVKGTRRNVNSAHVKPVSQATTLEPFNRLILDKA